MRFYTLFIIIGVLASCSQNKTSENRVGVDSTQQSTLDEVEEDSFVYEPVTFHDYSQDETTESSNARNSSSTSKSAKRFRPCQPIMDDDEDAYEEGASLREEDRLNGTRNHEGDNYDDDYDDDYDDGYDE